jgi:hypothetical protein
MSCPEAEKLIVVCEKGDLILKVGGEPVTSSSEDAAATCAEQGTTPTNPQLPIKSIKVSSQTLVMISPVLDRILNGKFRGGQLDFSQQIPPTISLPEDKPAAMLTLCQIVHHQHDDEIVHDRENPQAILDMAILCDKYECQSAVMYWFHWQLLSESHCIMYPEFQERAMLIRAAWLMDSSDAFYHLTKAAMLRTSWTHGTGTICRELDWPSGLAWALQSTQGTQLEDLRKRCQDLVGRLVSRQVLGAAAEFDLQSRVMTAPDGKRTHAQLVCVGASERMGKFVGAMCAIDMWEGSSSLHKGAGADHIALVTVIDSLKKVARIQDDCSTWAKCAGTCKSCTTTWTELMENMTADFLKTSYGLCLECAKYKDKIHNWDGRPCWVHLPPGMDEPPLNFLSSLKHERDDR